MTSIRERILELQNCINDCDYASAIEIGTQVLSSQKRIARDLQRQLKFLIGEAYYWMEQYPEAANYFQEAYNLDGNADEFNVMRLGEAMFYLEQERDAANLLAGAYMLGGKSLFKEEPKEIKEFLKKVLRSKSSSAFSNRPFVSTTSVVDPLSEELFRKWPKVSGNTERLPSTLFRALCTRLDKCAMLTEKSDSTNAVKETRLAWAIIPEPKNKWSETQLFLMDACDNMIELKRYDEAMIWHKLMMKYPYGDKAAEPFEIGAKIYLELGQDRDAYLFLHEYKKRARGERINLGKKYVDFYKKMQRN